MNNTPCTLCNFLALKRRQAFVKREYAELRRYEAEHEAHRQTCETVNDAWYRGLWPAAVVLSTVYAREGRE